MKIAIVITGHIRRNFQINLPNTISSITKKTDTAHIYGAVWDKTELEEIVPLNLLEQTLSEFTVKNIEYHDIQKYNSEKSYFQLEYDRLLSIEQLMGLHKLQVFRHFADDAQKERRGTHCGFTEEAIEYWFNRIRDQYYLVNKGINLVDPDSYDLIYRIRTDYLPMIILKRRKDLKNKVVMISGYDCIQYGGIQPMMVFKDLYTGILDYKENLSLLNQFGYDSFNAENMLRHYLKTNGVKIIEEPLVEGRDFNLGRS